MPRVDVVVRCPMYDSFRVQQVAGMFDVPLADEHTETFSAEIPALDEPWEIGLIVGPSGSGKSTIARTQWPAAYTMAQSWPEDRAVIDGFSTGTIKEITVLSNGERFRCDMARAIIEGGDLVVFDEFTSVVDRSAARIGSAAVAKAVRRMGRRFVGVSCHYDIARWLQPDWVLDMHTGALTRRRLRRPPIRMDIYRSHASAWAMFAKYHYLSAALNRSAHCYLGVVDRQPAAFCAVLPLIGWPGRRRISRIVVRPDFQGIGVGRALLNAVAALYPKMCITGGHPAMIAALKNDPHWRCTAVKRIGHARQPEATRRKSFTGGTIRASSSGRIVCNFEFLTPHP